MARDADGNYYYDEGTLAEQLDEWDVYEDADGNVGFYDGSAELRLQNAGHVFGDSRAVPTEDELAEGEQMLFVNSADGQLTVAVGSSSTDDTVDCTVEAVTAFA